MELRPGYLIYNRYKIIRKLGEGGFGIVYLACDTHMPHKGKCIVKQLIHSTIQTTRGKSLELFNREAQALSLLMSKAEQGFSQVPELLGVTKEAGSHYIIQEYIEGDSLRYILKQTSQPQSAETVARWLRDALEILTFIHQKGIIHRDIKPENLILKKPDEKIVLIDFGCVAKFGAQRPQTEFGNSDSSCTKITSVGYSPQEQAYQASSDLYSLGMTAIEALTGKPPWKLRTNDYLEVDIREETQHINSQLISCLEKMVKRIPSERFQSAREAIDALEQKRKRTFFTRLKKRVGFLSFFSQLSKRYVYIMSVFIVFSISVAYLLNSIAEPPIADQLGEPAATAEADAAYQSGMKKYSEGAYDEAIRQLSVAIEADGRFANAYYLRGQAYQALQQYDNAISDYSTAIEIVPSYAFAYVTRGNSRYAKKEYDKAISDYNEAILISPQEESAYLNRGNAWYKKKDYDTALLNYEKAIEINEESAFAHFWSGNVWYERENYEKAVNAYAKAIAIDENFADAYRGRGNSFLQKEEYDQAIDDYTKAVAIDENNSEAYFSMGIANGKRDQSEQALLNYGKAIEANPQHSMAYNNRGVLKYKKENYAEAIIDYTMSISTDSTNILAYHNRCIAQKNIQEYEKALIDCEKAAELYRQSENVEAYTRVSELISQIRQQM